MCFAYQAFIPFKQCQLISKANCQAVNSSKKQTNEFIFTSMQRVFVHILEEIEDSKKTFRNHLTFRGYTSVFHKIYLLYNGRITESEVWRPEKGPFLLAVIQNTFRKFLGEALVQNRVQTSVLGGNNILEKALHWLMDN